MKKLAAPEPALYTTATVFDMQAGLHDLEAIAVALRKSPLNI